MTIDSIRAFCRSLPHTTEDIKWENNLCFLIGGKMFAVVNLATASARLAFKCTPERCAELVEVEGIIPAPYMARYHWVTMLDGDALRPAEVRDCLEESYQMVMAGLPRKVQQSFTTAATTAAKTAAKPSRMPEHKPARSSAATKSARKSAGKSGAKPSRKSGRKPGKRGMNA